MKNLFPLVGVCIHSKKSFKIHVIDFENETVFNRTSQNGDGKSYNFSDIYIMEAKDESVVDMLMNSEVNYDNYKLIDGDNRIYDHEYHKDINTDRIEEIRVEKERKMKIEKHNNQIAKKIHELKKQFKS